MNTFSSQTIVSESNDLSHLAPIVTMAINWSLILLHTLSINYTVTEQDANDSAATWITKHRMCFECEKHAHFPELSVQY